MPANRNSARLAKKINRRADVSSASHQPAVGWSEIQNNFSLRRIIANHLKIYQAELSSILTRLEDGGLITGLPDLPPPPDPASAANTIADVLRNLQGELKAIPACDFGALRLLEFNRPPLRTSAMRRLRANPACLSRGRPADT